MHKHMFVALSVFLTAALRVSGAADFALRDPADKTPARGKAETASPRHQHRCTPNVSGR